MKKIAFIGGFKKLYDEEGKAKTFEKLGCEVLRIQEEEMVAEDVKRIFEWGPDYVLGAKFNIPQVILDDLFKVAKEKGVKTISWHPDLYCYPTALCMENRLAISTLKWGCWGADYTFSPDGSEYSRRIFDRVGVNHHLLRQAPYDETVGVGEDLDLDFPDVVPILFVGGLYQNYDNYRSVLLEVLSKKYGDDKFFWVGKDNPDQVREEQLSALFKRTKVVIGDCINHPSYWSNRLYETLGRGGFMIHPYTPEIENEFVEDEECVYYDRWNFEQLCSLIDYYVDEANEGKRQSIIKKGMERVKNDHTLLNRCKELLEVVNGTRSR